MKSVHTKGKRSYVRFAVGLFSLILTAFTVLSCEAPESRDVAVFMYHDFVHDGESAPWAVTESVFEAHVKALSDAGYTGVDFADLRGFVLGEGDLPEKCVVLSCDDGYSGVLDIALPICEKYGMKLTCAVIGGSVTEENHFYPDPALADRIELTSHSYAIHSLPGGYLMSGLDDEEYRAAVLKDTTYMTDAFAEYFPEAAQTLVYPYGACDERSEAVLTELGYTVTVTVDSGTAHLVRGDESTLRRLPRYGGYQNTTVWDLLWLAGGASTYEP